MKETVVYRHIRLSDNKVFYIGIGNKKRPYCRKERNNFWKNTVKKHGYIVEIIQENLSWEDACELEVFLIKTYGRKDLKNGNLVNLTNGGEGTVGVIRSDETRKKQSESSKGIKHSQETKDKMSKQRKGNKHLLGHKHSLESIAKMSKAKKGKILSEETKEKMRKPKTNETKLKMSLANKRRDRSIYESVANKNKKLILNIYSGIFYLGTEDAANSVNMERWKLIEKLNGKNKTNHTGLMYV